MEEERLINSMDSACGPDKKVPVKQFDIVAISIRIVYNKKGDHDPNGLLFVLKEDEKKIIRGAKKPKPLILRDAGECIEVTLTNHLFKPISQDNHPEVPVNAPFAPSIRVSLHAQVCRISGNL